MQIQMNGGSVGEVHDMTMHYDEERKMMMHRAVLCQCRFTDCSEKVPTLFGDDLPTDDHLRR